MLISLAFVCLLSACSHQPAPETPEVSKAEAETAKLEAENEKLRERISALEDERNELRAEKKRSTAPAAAADGTNAEGSSAPAAPKTNEPRVLDDGRELPVVRLTPAGAVPAPATGERPVIEARGSSVAAAKHLPTAGEETGATIQLNGNGRVVDYDAGMTAYDSGSYSTAVASFNRFLRTNPQHPFADNALYWRGTARLALGQLSVAEKDFEQLIQRYPGEGRVPDAWLALGRIEERRGDAAAARLAYDNLIQRHPNSSAVSQIPSAYRK